MHGLRVARLSPLQLRPATAADENQRERDQPPHFRTGSAHMGRTVGITPGTPATQTHPERT